MLVMNFCLFLIIVYVFSNQNTLTYNLLLSILGIYSPVSLGNIIPIDTATGRNGVWREMRSECHASDKQVVEQMEDDIFNIQPECNDFILVELQSGASIAVCPSMWYDVYICLLYSNLLNTFTFSVQMVQPT